MCLNYILLKWKNIQNKHGSIGNGSLLNFLNFEPLFFAAEDKNISPLWDK